MLVLRAFMLYLLTLPFLISAQAVNPEKASRCKQEVMTHQREFRDIPMAAFSIRGHHHDNVLWNIHWDGRTANGSCQFHNHQFKSVEVKTHLNHHSKQKQSEHYKGNYGDFYYDWHVGQWRDPDGKICHTCTPENGFPRHGG
ncbi:MAG: hypothetical protein ABJK20_01300 [Halieaceae bacterium]